MACDYLYSLNQAHQQRLERLFNSSNAVEPPLKTIAPLPTPPPRLEPTATLPCIDAVSGMLNVEPVALLSTSRGQKQIADARHLAMYLALKTTNMTTITVGRMFNRDHSTVVYATGKIEERMANDSIFASAVRDMINRLMRSMASYA